jgi:hypothetical protein
MSDHSCINARLDAGCVAAVGFEGAVELADDRRWEDRGAEAFHDEDATAAAAEASVIGRSGSALFEQKGQTQPARLRCDSISDNVATDASCFLCDRITIGKIDACQYSFD